jgi:hypothetical protein
MSDVLNSRVTYIRKGARKGWTGTIINIEGKRVVVAYDNGVEQDYTISALCMPGDPTYDTALYSHGDNCKYLKVQYEGASEESCSPTCKRPAIAGNACIVMNTQTGKVELVTLDADEANLFAAEQAQESRDYTKYTVFIPTNSYCIKRPKVAVTTHTTN